MGESLNMQMRWVNRLILIAKYANAMGESLNLIIDRCDRWIAGVPNFDFTKLNFTKLYFLRRRWEEEKWTQNWRKVFEGVRVRTQRPHVWIEGLQSDDCEPLRDAWWPHSRTRCSFAASDPTSVQIVTASDPCDCQSDGSESDCMKARTARGNFFHRAVRAIAIFWPSLKVTLRISDLAIQWSCHWPILIISVWRRIKVASLMWL